MHWHDALDLARASGVPIPASLGPVTKIASCRYLYWCAMSPLHGHASSTDSSGGFVCPNQRAFYL